MPKFGQRLRRSVIACVVVVGVAAAPARAAIDGGSLLKASEVDGAIDPHTHFDEQTNPRDGTCEWIAKSPAAQPERASPAGRHGVFGEMLG